MEGEVQEMSCFKPFHDNVLVKRDEIEEKKTPGGIVIPKKGQGKPDTAVVLAVGSGRKMNDGTVIRPEVSVGDTVFISRFAGTDILIDEEKATVVQWSEILGVLE